ncbi:hypothetical protein BS47DRAFT_1391445 [Hydnum rufescens UP504]|uniref:Acetyl-CoA synthetase-like protein n=1 Tax=Hydnum rufescens UP504 TaxID=1448309 RepID=A0A9P6DY47_9AGAM|nr:hypothetical protein BS47DRAFT_1391445 [Hydnum rufescens UP504]
MSSGWQDRGKWGGFKPTPESIPPSGVVFRFRSDARKIPVNVTPLNPINFLLRAAFIVPNKLAIAHPDVPHPSFYTFAVWAQRVQNLAYALIERGIQPGDRVAVIAPNSPMIADAHHAIIAARAVITPINIRLTKDSVDYILEHSGSKVILVDHAFVHLVENAKVPVIVCNDTGRPDDPYEQLLASGRRFSRERGWLGLDMEMNEDAAASLCYTSGTTGRPKGVISTLRGSYLAAIANAYETRMDRNSIYLWILPMFHACGWTYPWAITFAFSTQITIRSADPDLIWHHIINSGVTHYCAAPLSSIISSHRARRLDDSRSITAVVAGAAPTSSLIGQLEKLKIRVTHVYGLTLAKLSSFEVCSETYGPFTRNYHRPAREVDETKGLADEDSRIMARQGHAFVTSDEARVVYQAKEGDPEDAELKDVPDDGVTRGEVVVRGNIKNRFTSIIAIPRPRRKHFAEVILGVAIWLFRNPDGSIMILDRIKDLIISGGENASSLSIEQELSRHPDVLEVTVEDSTFRPKDRHAAFEKELKKYAAQVLPGFARPEWVEVVDELPKTSTGKVLKHVLRGRAAKL